MGGGLRLFLIISGLCTNTSWVECTFGGYFVRRQVAVDRILYFPYRVRYLYRVHAEGRVQVQVTCPLRIPYWVQLHV